MSCTEMDEIRELTADVDGWLIEGEGKLFYHTARRCTGEGAIVEIGSWKGKSTIWLGKGSKAGNGVRTYAIDPHTGSPEHQEMEQQPSFEEFERNIARIGG